MKDQTQPTRKSMNAGIEEILQNKRLEESKKIIEQQKLDLSAAIPEAKQAEEVVVVTPVADQNELGKWESAFASFQNENINTPKPHLFEAPESVMVRLFPHVSVGEYVCYKGVIVMHEGKLEEVEAKLGL